MMKVPKQLYADRWAQNNLPSEGITASSDGVHWTVRGTVTTDDPVTNPAHYTYGDIEVLDAIEAWALPYHLGNVVKYVARAAHKGKELEDLRKAQCYLVRYIALLESCENHDTCE